MKFLVQVICVSEHVERRQHVFEMEREHLTMETLGLGLGESKALLRGVQEFVVAQQVAADLERRRHCPDCGKRHASKAQGSIKVKTVFGPVEVPNPRWHRCSCQSTGPSTFRPVTSWLNGRTSPELMYLETKWASLIPYAKVAELLKDVLPVADTLNQETVRNHLHVVANRIEQELGEEPVRLFEGSDQDWEEQPLPDGPMTVGIDGGFVRAAHKEGWFEVIAGKRVVAFRREENEETPSAKCFGFFQTYDEKPRRRLWELLKSQGMQENQQVVFLSDGGDTVRLSRAVRISPPKHPSTTRDQRDSQERTASSTLMRVAASTTPSRRSSFTSGIEAIPWASNAPSCMPRDECGTSYCVPRTLVVRSTHVTTARSSFR